MTTLVHREDGLLVLDEVLAPCDFEALRHELARAEFRGVHDRAWDRGWRLWDGQPLRGPSVYFDPGRTFGWRGATYPTATVVDLLVDAVRGAARECPSIAGEEGLDWIALYLSPWLYPVGSALSLHRDANRYSGSFAYFAHDRWSAHWGGELVVPDPSDDLVEDDAPWAASACAGAGRGIARCISPHPNRLVLLGPDRPHRVARIDANAGAHVRASIAGFFLRPAR